MIKLIEILNELAPSPPDSIYAGGKGPKDSDDFIKKGFRLGNTSVDSETGKSETDVEYLPKLEKIRLTLMQYRKEFQPFKFSTNPDIAKISKDINTGLTKISNMIYALDKMIELYKNA